MDVAVVGKNNTSMIIIYSKQHKKVNHIIFALRHYLNFKFNIIFLKLFIHFHRTELKTLMAVKKSINHAWTFLITLANGKSRSKERKEIKENVNKEEWTWDTK